MSHARDDVISWLEEKIRTNTESEEEYELYLQYRRDGTRVFNRIKYQDIIQQLQKEAINYGASEGRYLQKGKRVSRYSPE